MTDTEQRIGASLPGVRWIADVGCHWSNDINLKLISTFYGSFSPLGLASLNSMAVAFVAYLRTGIGWFLWLIALDAFTLALRYVVIRRPEWPSDGLFIGGLAWTLILAVTTALVVKSGDQTMIVVTLAWNFAACAGIVGRNFAAPRYALVQVMLIILGYFISFGMDNLSVIPLLVIQCILFGFVSKGIIAQHRGTMIRALKGEARERDQASRDPLTGLLNRRGLQAAFEARRKARDEPLVLFYLDLDEFKQINDQHGHLLGDQLLCAVARRLEGILGPSRAICRLGGDEFLILAGNAGPQSIRALGQDILAAIAMPHRLDDAHEFRIGASAGAAWMRNGPDALQVGMAEADKALYRAKAKGKGVCVLSLAPTEAAQTTSVSPRTA
ncbi:MAG: GGDEF domain-containing protein [Pseudomonadota bacterium]|nr:GGDEF domain-containing protein [Pseudomonadota bacterium]